MTSAHESRLVELIGGLSLATDLAAGLADETALRTCVLATQVAEALGVSGAALADVYYAALLRFIGCTAFAHETAWEYGAGDDQAFLGAMAAVDSTRSAAVVRQVIRAQPKSAGLKTRAAAVAHLVTQPQAPRWLAIAHCELAVALAGKLQMSPGVKTALGQMYERWDGKGHPRGLRGDEVCLPARVIQLAWEMVVQARLGGAAGAAAVARARRDKAFDPRVVDAFVAQAGEWLGRRPASVWDDLLACEPAPVRRVADVGVAEVAQAFATYVDVKSPYTLGHSSAVARLAVAAARAAGIRGEAELEHLRIAALLHDLGFVSVPNGILEKPSALNAAEWERVRLHAYQTERVLSYAPCFRGFARLASSDHERLDGSGYPRGAAEAAGDRPAHLLAVADVLTALLEARAHRAAMTPDQAVKTLALEARRGTLDREAVDAVLAASGLGKSGAGADADGHGRGEPRLRGEGPSRLSERELEVLTLLARGLSNKQIGVELGISPKTAQHHVAHIYEKTGVSSRAAAATYAAVNELV
jgi:HD-GYP domain-containing protein (c-di-GMP phosphodiesterase class II)/DNA-binding CsgD family transcriptional regulator